MAKLLTKKYQYSANSKLSAYGKYYGRIVHTETLTIDEFANHISKHGSPFDRSTITGVLMVACDCLVELTLDSKRVRLGDLGTFYMSAEAEGTEAIEDFSADNIKRVHLRFRPNRKQSYPLDSVSLRKKASFTDLSQLVEGAASEGKTPESGNPDSSTNGGGNDDGGGLTEERP